MKWPVLQSFDQAHLERIAMPVGGIGTGTVSLGGRGDLRDWEIVNRPGKGYVPQGQGVCPFFALYAKDHENRTYVRLLEGPVELTEYEGALGSVARNHGFPRFRHCEFKAAYPFGQVLLSDPTMPVNVVLKAFNPLIPGDVDSSAYPAAVIRIEVKNVSAGALEASVCLSVPNFIGEDGSQAARADLGVNRYKSGKANRNCLRDGQGLTGIHMTAPALQKGSEQYGDLYLSTRSGQDITCRTSWADLSWGDTKLDFWDDFSADGRLEEQASDDDKPVGSLCVSQRLAAGETREITFLLTWRFPNRKTWSRFDKEALIIGNHYATRFADSVEAAVKLYGALDLLEKKTLAFVHSVCGSSLPETVLAAALFNISTLRTQTCFMTPDGNFYGWEGCHDHQGCCPGSCNHVWNYEHATAFLFGDLARTMREVEFKHATDERGHMVFRVDLPLDRRPEESSCKSVAAADGQMGCIMKLYRDWQLSGNDALLRDLYPKAKKALEFCWAEGGWDADRDGLMEGCQHNTMDVEYYGPNPQMGFWYLGALRAMQEMAGYLGDDDFAGTCRKLFESGSKGIDERLFNGDYYEHRIEPPNEPGKIAGGLRLDMGSKDLARPDLQLGSGCLIDQLVGQYTAHILGLGYLSDTRRQQRALATIFKCNFKEGFHEHFNHFRSFVLGDESGVLMATYPKGRRPERPFPYFNEVMTGFEYVLAVHMLYEGMADGGLKIIRAIRDRFDGKKRNPFDEAECGHHYARAMASWSALIALTGFRYSGVGKRMEFKAANGSYFWSNGYAWGRCTIADERITVDVQHGVLELKTFQLVDVGGKEWEHVQRIEENGRVSFAVGAQ
ncbi:MAG: GH116 family glycosyl-hydrolase [bacterium]